MLISTKHIKTENLLIKKKPINYPLKSVLLSVELLNRLDLEPNKTGWNLRFGVLVLGWFGSLTKCSLRLVKKRFPFYLKHSMSSQIWKKICYIHFSNIKRFSVLSCWGSVSSSTTSSRLQCGPEREYETGRPGFSTKQDTHTQRDIMQLPPHKDDILHSSHKEEKRREEKVSSLFVERLG